MQEYGQRICGCFVTAAWNRNEAYAPGGGLASDDIFAAAKEAGHQLVTGGGMSAETLKRVSRNPMSLEQQKQGANQFFQQMLNNAKGE